MAKSKAMSAIERFRSEQAGARQTEPTMWTPANAGDYIVGKLVESRPPYSAHSSTSYILDVDGAPFLVWGGAVLDSRLSIVPKGSLVCIQFDGLGKAKGGNSAPKMFTVDYVPPADSGVVVGDDGDLGF